MLLPMYVIAELIGLPDEYRLTAKRLSHLTAQRVSSNAAPEAAIAASLELNDYLLEETKRRRRNLGDDLISTIMTTPMIDDTGAEHYLDDEQIAAFFFEFTFAGNDTTTRSIANGDRRASSWYPDQRHELVADPSLIPNGVEELVRWDTPSHYLGRTTTEDVELPYGTIPAGSTVAVVLASANHDERMYEEPELLDIHRHVRPQARVRHRPARVHRRGARPVRAPHRVRGVPGPVPRLPRRRHRLRAGPVGSEPRALPPPPGHRPRRDRRRPVVARRARRRTSTVPAVPSMRTVSPVRMRARADDGVDHARHARARGPRSRRGSSVPRRRSPAPPPRGSGRPSSGRWPRTPGSRPVRAGRSSPGRAITRAIPSTTPGLTPRPSIARDSRRAPSAQRDRGRVADEQHREIEGSRTPPPAPCRKAARARRSGAVPVTNSSASRWNTSSGASSSPRAASVVAERPGRGAGHVERSLRDDLHLLAEHGEPAGVGDRPHRRVVVRRRRARRAAPARRRRGRRRARAPVAAGPSASGIDAMVSRIGRSRLGSSRQTVA